MSENTRNDITLADVYYKLGGLEGKVDIIMPGIVDLDKRVSSLEKDKAKRTGVMSVLGILWGLIVAGASWVISGNPNG